MFKKTKTLIKLGLDKFNSIAKQPKRAIIETTNFCNLNCPFCMVGIKNSVIQENGNAAHDLMKRRQGMMTKETFGIVKNKLKKFGIKHVYLHFQGEPFLNKLTPEFAKELKAEKFKVSVFTNGQVLNEKILNAFKFTNIDLLRFSVDGASEETYQKNRVGGTFEKVLKNMELSSQILKGTPTRIEWQFLALSNNEHEIEEAKKIAKKINVNFFVKGFRVTDPDLAPKDLKYRSKFLKKPCTDIYLQLGIYWNGDVVPCCYDVDAFEIMGNLLESDLKTIWKSEKYKSFRKNVERAISNPENEPELCRRCLRWR